MGVKRKASAVEEQQPPLPEEEAPPLPDEPLPTADVAEQPPLPDEEAPALPQEPIPKEQPPLPDGPASLADEPLPGEDEPSPSVPSDLDDSDLEDSETSTPNPDTALTQTTTATKTEEEPDSWQAIWEPAANAYYFYNTQTHETTWLNPRLPPSEAAAYLAAHPPQLATPGSSNAVPEDIYDPETGEYAFTARFNAKTGKFQNNPEHTAENFSTQGQLMRTAKEYFDVQQMTEGKKVGQSGGSLRADRRQMMRQMTKKQRREFIEQCKKKKDDKKREWYRNDDIIVRKH